MPTQEIQIEKKPKTSSAAREGPPATEMFVIDLTSSKGKKDKAARSKPVTSAMLKIASTIVDKITQRRGSVVPLVLISMPIHPSGVKFGSPFEGLATMKNDKVDSA
ncbi:hypothetical protein COP2_041703 [Malus domestica]